MYVDGPKIGILGYSEVICPVPRYPPGLLVAKPYALPSPLLLPLSLLSLLSSLDSAALPLFAVFRAFTGGFDGFFWRLRCCRPTSRRLRYRLPRCLPCCHRRPFVAAVVNAAITAAIATLTALIAALIFKHCGLNLLRRFLLRS